MSDSSNITSRPWDNIAAYEDAEWHEIYQTLFDGSEERGPLLNWGGEFEVTASDPAAMTIEVATGAAIIGGLWGKLVTEQTLTVAANASGATRYDLVFLHWTRTNQTVQLRIVDGSGVTCSTAVAPATNAIGTYQTAGPPVTQWAVPLACIEVANGATTIDAGDITDLREFCRFRTEPYDLCDNSSIDLNASYQMQIANDGVDVDEISSTIAGDALTGGGGSALDVVPDGTSLEINADQLRIAAGAAGNGLTGGGGAALAVGVDGTTIQIVADQLQVVANSLDDSYIADRNRLVWISASEMEPSSGAPPAWGTFGGYPVSSEGWLFSTGVNEYVVFHCNVPADIDPPDTLVPLYFVWAHDYGAGGAFTVRWHMIYCAYVVGAPATWTYHCDDPLTSTLQGTVEVGITSAGQGLRQCDHTGENLYHLDDVSYMEFQVGRNGAHPNDDYAADALLLGCYFEYEADM